jgi:Secretion system C-terminal sorting domain
MSTFIRNGHSVSRCMGWCLLGGLLSFFCGPAQSQNSAMVIGSGTTVTVTENALVLNNLDLFCNGNFLAPSGAVWITGSNNSSFNGTGVPNIQTLQLNTGTSSVLSLNTGLQVSGSLIFQNGLIDLNGQQLQLLGSASLQGESETSRITAPSGGTITATAAGVSAPNQLDIGNLGAMLTSSVDMGDVTVSRSQEPATNPGNSNLHGIQRTFLIQPQNDVALNANLRFYYLDAELNGGDAATLRLWKSLDGVSWSEVGVDSRDATAKYVEKDGLSDLSYWTLSDQVDPLPLTLVSFSVICQGSYALVQWQTGEESNVGYFLVQRSADGVNWIALSKVSATDNATGSSYSYLDNQPSGGEFYRLQIVDNGGNETYSPVFRGGCSDITLPLMVYPNPAEGQTVAQISVRQAVAANLLVFDVNGRQVYHSGWSLQPGINQLVLPVYALAAGNYIIKVLLSNSTQQTQLIKK